MNGQQLQTDKKTIIILHTHMLTYQLFIQKCSFWSFVCTSSGVPCHASPNYLIQPINPTSWWQPCVCVSANRIPFSKSIPVSDSTFKYDSFITIFRVDFRVAMSLSFIPLLFLEVSAKSLHNKSSFVRDKAQIVWGLE